MRLNSIIHLIQTMGWKIPIVFLSVFILCLMSTIGLRWNEDIMDALPKDSVASDFRTFSRSFDAMDYCYFSIGPADKSQLLNPDVLFQAADKFEKLLLETGQFKKLIYRWDTRDFYQAMGQIINHRASLFTGEDEKQLQQKLQPDAMERSLLEWKHTLIESPAPFVGNQFYGDPLGINELFVKKLSSLQAQGGSLTVMQGRLTTTDGRHVLMIGLPIHPSSDHFKAKEFVDKVQSKIRIIEQQNETALVDIAWFGGHLAAVENSSQIKRDVIMTIVISIIAISLLCYLVFRRLILVLLMFIPVLFGATFASGLVRWINPDVCAISIGCGSMLIGISMDFGLHLLYGADQLSSLNTGRELMAKVLRRLFFPIVMSALTTMAAFGVLQLSILPGYQDLGMFACLGILGATLTALFVLPVIIQSTLYKQKTSKPRSMIDFTRFFDSVLSPSAKHKKWSLIFILVLTTFSLFGMQWLGFDGDIQKLNSLKPKTQADWDLIAGQLGNMMESTTFMVSGKDFEEALQRNESVQQQFIDYQKQGMIKGVNSITELLPSRSRQAENRQRWVRFWSNQKKLELEDSFVAACRKQKIRPEAFDQFWEKLPGDMPEIIPEDYQTGLLDELLSNSISKKNGRFAILTKAVLLRQDIFEKLVAESKQSIPSFIGFSGIHFVSHMVQLINLELRRLGFICLAVISILLFIVLRNFRTAVSIIIPLLISLVWTFGTMGWLGLKFNMMNSMVTIFILGLIVDYGIFLVIIRQRTDVKNKEERQQFAHTCGAITVSALTTLCGMGVLTIAGHPALHTIGFTALIGISSGYIAVFSITPLLDRLYKFPQFKEVLIMNANNPQEQIITVLIEHLKAHVVASNLEFDASVSLSELGIDSFAIVEMLLFIESRFGVMIPDSELAERVMEPIENLAVYISEFSKNKC